jgi:hypothetical protein
LPWPAGSAGLLFSVRNRWETAPARSSESQQEAVRAAEDTMLWTIFAILLILWLLGFAMDVAGGLIHILLVIAAVVLIINLLSGRRVA